MSSQRAPMDQHQDKQGGRFRGPALLVIAAVMAWGIYLAVGAATHESQDIRKAAIIVACTIGFLLFWVAFLVRAVKSQTAGTLSPVKTEPLNDWNVASIYSFLAALGVNGLVATALLAQNQLSDLAQGRLLVGGFVLAASACVAAVIGLSRSNKPRGHNLAFLGICLLLLGLVLGFTALQKSARKPLLSVSERGEAAWTRFSISSVR